MLKLAGRYGGPGFARITNVEGPDWRLRFEIGAMATDLMEAQEELGAIASTFAQSFSLAANAAIGMLNLTSSYRCEPGGEYARDVQLGERCGAVAPRDLDMLLGARVASAIWDKGERYLRAVWHFTRALEIWEPRLLAPAAGHLWIAAETLGPIAERRCIEQAGLPDAAALAKHWMLTADSPAQLRGRVVNEAITRMVFGGDADVTNRLRAFANGWEHGFRSFGTLRPDAAQLVDEVAFLVRRSLLAFSDLNADDRIALAAPIFKNATAMWGPAMQLAGTISGAPELFSFLGEPIEPAGRLIVETEAAEPPAWRTYTTTAHMDHGAGHPAGVTLHINEHAFLAPDGRAPGAHTFSGPVITLNDVVVHDEDFLPPDLPPGA